MSLYWFHQYMVYITQNMSLGYQEFGHYNIINIYIYTHQYVGTHHNGPFVKG